ncbi:hypothetical protein OG21DRAFT_1602089 [Imleria badia]|nr:hypothetical protein OG21DRAFT_1602089 [Imleria badia]
MPTEFRCEVNPFESPVKAIAFSARTTAYDTRTRQPDVLATADLFLEQLKELENLCSTVEERVQRKRKALKELEYLILGSNSPEGSPRSPVCPANTPISSRLRFVSPRLRGLFDLRGPGQANLDSIQTCLDYSPETHPDDNISTREDPGHSDEWVEDDDEEALLLYSCSPFDDKYALRQSPRTEKKLPAIPSKGAGEVVESKIPRKVHVRREVSTRRLTGRPPSAVTRSTSHRRRPSVRSVKTTNAASGLTTKGTMRRGSWKRSILENVKTGGGASIENESAKDSARRKEKRKGLWSIYSVWASRRPRAVTRDAEYLTSVAPVCTVHSVKATNAASDLTTKGTIVEARGNGSSGRT